MPNCLISFGIVTSVTFSKNRVIDPVWDIHIENSKNSKCPRTLNMRYRSSIAEPVLEIPSGPCQDTMNFMA
jgi:regulatory protein YycI of two-component signal transduction system YycFG